MSIELWDDCSKYRAPEPAEPIPAPPERADGRREMSLFTPGAGKVWIGQSSEFTGTSTQSSDRHATVAEKDLTLAAKRVRMAALGLPNVAAFGWDIVKDEPKMADAASRMDKHAYIRDIVLASGSVLSGLGSVLSRMLIADPTMGRKALKKALLAKDVGAFGWSIYSLVDTAMNADDPDAQGRVDIMADSSANVSAVESMTVSGGVGAQVIGGLSASLKGVFADVSGVMAGLQGLFATVSGYSAGVQGYDEVMIAARKGNVKLKGKRIEVGFKNPEEGQAGWLATHAFGSPQVSTRSIKVAALDEVEVSAGEEDGQARITLTKDQGLHAGHKDAFLHVDNLSAALATPSAHLVVSDAEIDLAVPMAPLEPPETVYYAAELAREQAKAAAMNTMQDSIATYPVINAAARAAIGAAEDTYRETVKAANEAFKAQRTASTSLNTIPRARVDKDGARLRANIAKVDVGADGSVTLEHTPGTSIEMKNGAIALKADTKITIEVAGQSWTFGPTGLQNSAITTMG